MPKTSRRQFSESVVSVFEAVRDLYRSVDRVNLDLRDRLQEQPIPLKTLAGTSVAKDKERDDERRVIRAWYGRLLSPGVPQDDDTQDDVEVDEEAEEEDGSVKRRKRKTFRIVAKERHLIVKIVLYANDGERFEPAVVYGVVGNWRLVDRDGSIHRPKHFDVPVGQVRRILRTISAVPSDMSQHVATKARVRFAKQGKGKYMVAYRCFGRMQAFPLYRLDSANALDKLVSQIKRHWSKVGRRR